MLSSKLISRQFAGDTQEEINSCLAFLVENTHDTEIVFFGFKEGEENIKLEPKENRPFKASTGHTFEGELWIKTQGTCLLIKELPTFKESL